MAGLGGGLGAGAAARLSRADPPDAATPGLQRAMALLTDAVGQGDLPGAVLHVRRRGRIVIGHAAGWTDIGRTRALQPEHLFAVASLTKPVVAAAIMQLVERGAVRVTDPVATYLPEFARPRVLVRYDPATGAMTTRPARRAVTIRDLLTHTAGIHHGFAEVDSVAGAMYERAGVAHAATLSLAENMRRLGPLPLVHDPGERWTYGLSSDVLGRVVEVVSRTPLEQYLARRIFEPLAMRETAFSVPPAHADRVVPRYGIANGTLRAMPDPTGEPRYASGGGGLFTTAADYGRFAQALLDGGAPILTHASVRAMTTNQIGALTAFGFRWGFSLAVATPEAPGQVALPVGGFGWYGIFGTWFWVVPELATLVLMFTNVLRQDMTLPLFARVVHAIVRPDDVAR
jgi:CubicO group peptidase (beta-lactamase class C family)